MDLERLITRRARSIDASGIRRVFDLAAGLKDPVNLSIGQPDFDVPDAVKNAAIEAIQKGPNSYTQTQGIAPLREALSAEFATRFRQEGRWNDLHSLVTSGVSGGLVLALMACAEPGDQVLIPDPYFVMYRHLTRLAGAEPVLVDTGSSGFRLRAEQLEPLITDRTKVLLVSSPSNPTGVVLSEAEWQPLIELARRKNILIISDEIYDIFCYESVSTPIGPRCPSPASLCDQLLVLRGFSKSYGMTGWRLGAAFGPRVLIDQMAKLQQYTFVCAPSMVQQAGLAALHEDLSQHVTQYRKRRDRVVERLRDHYELVQPEGAFYAYPKVPAGHAGGQAFAEAAIARKLLIIPGNVFSAHDTHFRISYACNENMLEAGLDILIDLAR